MHTCGLCCLLCILALAIAIWAIVMTYKNAEQIENINFIVLGKPRRNQRKPQNTPILDQFR